jgi:hypothetical protein
LDFALIFLFLSKRAIMAISIDNTNASQNLQDLQSVRGKYGLLPLGFSSTDHILQVGTKAKYRLVFGTESERNNHYDLLITDPYVIPYYDISTEDVDSTASSEEVAVSKGLVSYHIVIEAKEVGEMYNIDFSTFLVGNSTQNQLVAGTSYAYKKDYQLSIMAFNSDNQLLFTKLYYPVIDQANNISTWNMNLAENLSPIVYTELPDLSLTALTRINTIIQSIKLMYGEAYIDDLVNNGALYFYPMDTVFIEIGNFKPSVKGIVDGKYFLANSFEFMNLWDRDKPYLIPCDGTYFLYFYLKNDAPRIEIITTVYFEDGTSGVFNQPVLELSSGVYCFPAGPNHHPDLDGLSNIKSYTMQIVIGDSVPFDALSEIFTFKIDDKKNAYEIFFLNQLGVFDRIGFDDIDNEYLKLNTTQYLSAHSNFSTHQTNTGGAAVSNIESGTRFNAIYQSGFNTARLKTWLKDFLASEEKYLLRDGNFYRIVGNKQEHLIEQTDNRVMLEFPFSTNHPIL